MRIALLVGLLLVVGCKKGDPGASVEGPPGHDGVAGAVGPAGAAGKDGVQGPAGKDATASGSRIVARWLTTADGARTFAGWHDMQIGADCQFLTASDGKTRCLPVGQMFQSGAGDATAALFYTDCAFATAVLYAGASALPPSLCGIVPAVQPGYGLIRANDTNCDGAMVVVTVGAPTGSVPASLKALDVNGVGMQVCGGVNVPTAGQYYAATVIDPATLVEGTIN